MILTTQFLNNLESQLEEQMPNNIVLINGTINQDSSLNENISLNASYNDFVNYLDQNIFPVIKITNISHQNQSETATKTAELSYTTISLCYIYRMEIIDNNYQITISSNNNLQTIYSNSLFSTDWYFRGVK